jgi:hypothetical protein
MQPTTHQTISELGGLGKVARHGSDRLRGLNKRLRVRMAYSFVILALCLMIADFCRLTHKSAPVPWADSSTYQSTRF